MVAASPSPDRSRRRDGANEGEATKESCGAMPLHRQRFDRLRRTTRRRERREISARYHRSQEPLVAQAIVDMPGSPWCNPLWPTLVVERLNPIGADELRGENLPGVAACEVDPGSDRRKLVVAEPAGNGGTDVVRCLQKGAAFFGATWN